MTYELTLTQQERKAIDWIGHRYFHGDPLRDILIDNLNERNPEYDDIEEWDSYADITFTLREHESWEIRDGLSSENYQMACFCQELRYKLITLCESIV